MVQDNFSAPVNCYLSNIKISAAVTRTAAAHPAASHQKAVEAGRGFSLPCCCALPLCIPCTPHPRPGPRLTAPQPTHQHHPAPPLLSLPIAPRQPRVPSRPTSPRPPLPGRLAPLCPAQPTPLDRNSATVGTVGGGVAQSFESTKPPPGFASAGESRTCWSKVGGSVQH